MSRLVAVLLLAGVSIGECASLVVLPGYTSASVGLTAHYYWDGPPEGFFGTINGGPSESRFTGSVFLSGDLATPVPDGPSTNLRGGVGFWDEPFPPLEAGFSIGRCCGATLYFGDPIALSEFQTQIPFTVLSLSARANRPFAVGYARRDAPLAPEWRFWDVALTLDPDQLSTGYLILVNDRIFIRFLRLHTIQTFTSVENGSVLTWRTLYAMPDGPCCGAGLFTVPEPGAMGLVVIGGVVMVGFALKRKRFPTGSSKDSQYVAAP